MRFRRGSSHRDSEHIEGIGGNAPIGLARASPPQSSPADFARHSASPWLSGQRPTSRPRGSPDDPPLPHRHPARRAWCSALTLDDTDDFALLDLRAAGDLLGLTYETMRSYSKAGMLPDEDGTMGRSRWWYVKTMKEWDAGRPGSPVENAPKRQAGPTRVR